MTGAEEALRDVLAGRAPSGDRLLQACRCEGFGAEAYAVEPILALIRRTGAPPFGAAHAIEADGHLALFGDDGRAAFADLWGERIGRLWVLGTARAPGDATPAVAVPHDTDLRQPRSRPEDRLFFDPADHPALDPEHAAAMAEAFRAAEAALDAALARARGGFAFRARAFCARAFSCGEAGAALFAFDGLLDGPQRRPFACYAAAHFRVRQGTCVRNDATIDAVGLDAALDAPWRPFV